MQNPLGFRNRRVGSVTNITGLLSGNDFAVLLDQDVDLLSGYYMDNAIAAILFLALKLFELRFVY